jgi:hypothetical protein
MGAEESLKNEHGVHFLSKYNIRTLKAGKQNNCNTFQSEQAPN